VGVGVGVFVWMCGCVCLWRLMSIFRSLTKQGVGTLLWRAPELFVRNTCNIACDVYR
jgi:hypothetical protein